MLQPIRNGVITAALLLGVRFFTAMLFGRSLGHAASAAALAITSEWASGAIIAAAAGQFTRPVEWPVLMLYPFYCVFAGPLETARKLLPRRQVIFSVMVPTVALLLPLLIA